MNSNLPFPAVVLASALGLALMGCSGSDHPATASDADAAATADAAKPAAPVASAEPAHDDAAATQGQGGGSDELHRIMEESKSMPMTMSGDVDKDFASMMTMHHQTAIRMIDVLLANGKAADLKALATKMKSDQQEEIKKMAPYAAGNGAQDMANMPGMAASTGESAGSKELQRIMDESKAKPMTMSGDVDKDFASMMTMHHQTAIKMSDVLLANGKAADLKALASKMKAAQQEEIKKMAPYAK